MKLRFPTQIAWLVTIACMAFVLALTVTGNMLATRIENMVGITLSAVCVYRYRRDAWRALIRDQPTNVQIVCLGLVIYLAGGMVRNLYSSIDRDFGLSWIRYGPVVPFFLFLFILSGALLLIGPKLQGGRIAMNGWIELGVVIATGIGIALAVTAIIALR